jgi:hypothetical protein
MRTPRPRRYVPAALLTMTRPLFRYSHTRDAFVLRMARGRTGPVLKRERRRDEALYNGPERRADSEPRGADGSQPTPNDPPQSVSGSL